jgi:pimeloyl-ACP methyl ester carboxylesterase
MSQSEPGEFDFLASDAALVGATEIPPVRRVEPTEGVSALAWGTGPAGVVLAHGAALNAHTWDSTLLAWSAALNHGDRYFGSPDALNRGDRYFGSPDAGFLALDLPGHGDSGWREDGDYAPDRIAPAVADALTAALDTGLLAPDFALVGQSLGGLVGLELLRAGRAEFSRLVLVDVLPLKPEAATMVASFLDGPTSFGSREEIVERAKAFGLGGASVERGVFLNTRIVSDGRVVWKHHLGALGPQALQHLTTEHLWEVIETSETPIDLVAATLSLVDDAAWNRFTTLRPDATAVRLPGSHNLQETSPVELAATLRMILG